MCLVRGRDIAFKLPVKMKSFCTLFWAVYKIYAFLSFVFVKIKCYKIRTHAHVYPDDRHTQYNTYIPCLIILDCVSTTNFRHTSQTACNYKGVARWFSHSVLPAVGYKVTKGQQCMKILCIFSFIQETELNATGLTFVFEGVSPLLSNFKNCCRNSTLPPIRIKIQIIIEHRFNIG